MARRIGFFVFLFLLGNLNPFISASEVNDYREKYADFERRYEAEILRLMEWAQEQGLEEDAKETRSLNHTAANEDQFYFGILPQEVQNPDLIQASDSNAKKSGKTGKSEKKKSSTKENRTVSPHEEWLRRYTRLRLQASNQLFRLAQAAVRDGRCALGFDFLMRALEENPDHLAARTILGYELVENHWLSPFEKKQARTMVFHPRFGWMLPKNVERYEAGERLYKGKWITEKQDAAAHFNIENGWTVETPHFTIVTNHSLPAAVKIGEEIEVLYRVWKQMFLRYFASDEQIQALFAGRSFQAAGGPRGTGTNGKHRLLFFRNQENYVEFLSPRYPQVKGSRGIYIMEDRTSYFFAGQEFDRATMLHEVTHQLFAELAPLAPRRSFELVESPNFWMIEGIATYMESLHDEENCHVVGGFETPRLLAARVRFVKNDFYVPLEEFSAMNTARFQAHPQMVRLYSQASGLMQFLLHSGGGQYRDGVTDILRDIYTGKATPDSIPNRLGKSFSELDDEYRAYISRNKEELEKWELD